MNIDDTETGRGKRLRLIRKMAGISVTGLAEKLNLTRATISIWENARVNRGITKKGAQNVIKFINSRGINCDINWLWFGTGKEPTRSSSSDDVFNEYLQTESNSKKDKRNKEIDFFYSLYDNAVIFEIKNSSMSPIYNIGDIVGGVWNDDINILNENYKNCIIEINDKLQVRRVKKTSDNISASFFTLCENEAQPFTIENINLKKIAVVKCAWLI